ncbi:MAG: hypothetical protein M3Y21_12035 [Candidatus Eremiobacteraeota bacterium]|nr:hypothetical protein [Candidatus Eremiobacteraeota bacterium]
MKHILPVLIVAMLVGASVPAYAAPAAAAPSVLPDCAGKPVAKPSNVILTCADAGVSVGKLRWTGWGSTFTAGLGVASVNDCEPNCAAGHFHNFNIVLLASGTEHCPNGHTAYSRVTYAWMGRSPYPKSEDNPVYRYTCGTRR